MMEYTPFKQSDTILGGHYYRHATRCKTPPAVTTNPVLWFSVIIMLLLFSPHLLAISNHGKTFIRNYSFQEYNHQPQNWGMVQEQNGILYFANQGGILEYDGLTWQVHANGYKMRSLAIDEAGTIFCGDENGDIWALIPDQYGLKKPIALATGLPKSANKLPTVWSTHALDHHVYFRTSDYLFIWDYQKITSIKASGEFKSSFIYNHSLLVQDNKRGLLQLVNHTLSPIPGGTMFTPDRIALLTPFHDETHHAHFLLGTRSAAFYHYQDGRSEPFLLAEQVLEYLKVYKPNHGIHLKDGHFAIATQKGLLIINAQGQLMTLIDRSCGLIDEDIKYVFQDQWQNLWLCLDNGIARLEYYSPFTVIKTFTYWNSLTLCVVTHNQKIVVGTRKGVYISDQDLQFQQVPHAQFSCNGLLSSRGHLFAATDKGGFLLDNEIPVPILADSALSLVDSTYFPGVIWWATFNNEVVALQERNGQWVEKWRVPLPNASVGSLAEGQNGDLWLGTTSNKVFKVSFPNPLTPPVVTSFDSFNGIKVSENYVATIGEQIVVASSHGLFKYDEQQKKILPYPILGTEYTGSNQAKPIFRICAGWDGQIWFNSQSSNYLVVPQSNNKYDMIARPFKRLPLFQVNHIYPDPISKTVWFARHDGLYGYHPNSAKDYNLPFQTIIKKVILNLGNKNQHDLFVYTSQQDNTHRPVPKLAFPYRHVSIEYVAPFFEAEQETMYQCFLQGYDREWTTWSKETKKNYNNLEPGAYLFCVRARNVYGVIGAEDHYRFIILAPWYKKWWMFFLYCVFIIFIISTLIRFRSRKLEREKQHLETVVTDRTKEIHHKNHQLEHQTRQLQAQSEKLKEMAQVKSRFFANISHEFRTPLTLIVGPLEEMLNAPPQVLKKKKIATMLSHSQRLLSLINQLLDLSRMDSGKEKLQATYQDIIPFIKTILASFETLTEQKGLQLHFTTETANVSFYYDAQKMEKIIYNLLMNAIKFTPSPGEIIFSVRLNCRQGDEGHPGWIEIAIKDSGVGIPPDQINDIFDRFFQAKNSKRDFQHGTGIGLALVREYVQLHHGYIDVHSCEGKGTEFVLRFPSGCTHLQADELSTMPSAALSLCVPSALSAVSYPGDEITASTEFFADNLTEPVPEEIEEKSPPLTKPIVLVVEDIADMRHYICDSLVKHYQVIEAQQGAEGIKKAREVIPDLIISDIMMPEIDGYQLCEILKKDIKTSHIPIILLTAKASQHSMIQGLDIGADDYITKPFNTAVLVARIRNLIQLRYHLQIKIQKEMLLQPNTIHVSSIDQDFINELKKIINKNLSDSLFSVEKLSAQMYMDRTTVYRKIKALTGESPQLFIRSYRLKVAAQLLKKKAGNVSQVALMVGFDNIAYFSKCFKEAYHLLPSLYMEAEAESKDG